jgi:hypothetical protein
MLNVILAPGIGARQKESILTQQLYSPEKDQRRRNGRKESHLYHAQMCAIQAPNPSLILNHTQIPLSSAANGTAFTVSPDSLRQSGNELSSRL